MLHYCGVTLHAFNAHVIKYVLIQGILIVIAQMGHDYASWE
jgi:hypothetical protein